MVNCKFPMIWLPYNVQSSLATNVANARCSHCLVVEAAARALCGLQPWGPKSGVDPDNIRGEGTLGTWGKQGIYTPMGYLGYLKFWCISDEL